VATQAFRDASNGAAFVKQLTAALGDGEQGCHVAVHIISQEEEARIGFGSAIATGGEDGEEDVRIVWDMGGGSFQICAEADDDARSVRAYR